MPELEDHQLLAEFARENSEAAFAALVSRHVNLVYSVALRKTGNPNAAEEVTQAVFIILAKKARGLSQRTILAGWLCETARLTAANYLRTEIRRQNREQEAYVQSLLNEQTDAEAWQRIAPLLDDALSKLNQKDRSTVVLRFLENRSLNEVGQALGASEDAAKMRVNRALEKMRKIFTKRGVTLTAVAIAGAVSANSIQAAPVGLVISVAATAAKGSALTASTLTLVKGALKVMAWTKIKTVTVASLVVLAPTAFIILLANNFETEAPSLTVSPPGNIQNKAVDSVPLLPHPSAPTYVLKEIGPMPGFDSSTATDINNQGQVIGWMDGPNGVVHAFIWDQGNATDLGTLGGSKAILTGINNSGEIVGVVLTNGERRAFMLHGTNQTDLGVIDGYAHLGKEGNISYTPGGLSINDKSQVSGRITVKDADDQRSFIQSQGQTSYFGLCGDGSICYAHAMNNRGQITGISLGRGGNPNYGVFLWQDGEITELQTLGGPRAYPSAINNQGIVVGWANPANTTNNQSHALLWEAGQMFDLNSAAGWKNSSAAGINNAGEIVGWATATNNHTFAFLKRGDAILDINDLVDTNSGWHLVSANSINDRGQILARGINGKLSQIFLVSPASLSPFEATKPEITSVQPSAAIAITTPFNLTTFERLPNGAFRLAFAGAPDGAYSVEASTNLTTWTLLGPALNENGNVTFTDMDAEKYTMRFYRAVQTLAPAR